VSVHPFTGGSHPTDVRITTRYSTGNWLQGVAGTVHEVGHALYEQGRNPKYDDLPVSRALSMGVHESQSLLWERMIFQVSTYAHVL
jgi:carboxypeptidase Taq